MSVQAEPQLDSGPSDGLAICVQISISMRGDTLGTGTDTDHDHNDDFTDWERSILNSASKYGVDWNPMVVDCSPRAYNRGGIRQDSIVG